MIVIEYPSKGFINSGKSAVNRGDDFYIKILTETKTRIFREATPFIFDDGGRVTSTLTMIKAFTILFRYLVVHFYALSANYKPEISEDEETLLLLYKLRE